MRPSRQSPSSNSLSRDISEAFMTPNLESYLRNAVVLTSRLLAYVTRGDDRLGSLEDCHDLTIEEPGLLYVVKPFLSKSLLLVPLDFRGCCLFSCLRFFSLLTPLQAILSSRRHA